MPKVETESRSCFAVTWFDDESEADEFAINVRHKQHVYNGGLFDGRSCGREKRFDRQRGEKRMFAVTHE